MVPAKDIAAAEVHERAGALTTHPCKQGKRVANE
jgi:hypothetical protein